MATEEEVVFDTRYDEEDDLRSESGSTTHPHDPPAEGSGRAQEETGGVADRREHDMNEDNQSEGGDEDDK